MRMQVKLEIGHKAACRQEPTPEGFTHDWTVFVRGSEGKDISHFVDKVVFHLHESFPRPKRAVKQPPFKLDECGYGSFELKIEVCFKTKDEPRKVAFPYDLFLPLTGYPPVTNVRTEILTFTHPNDDFVKKLTKGGGLQISSANGVSGNGLTNGHGSISRDESKEAVHKNSSIPDGDKFKKIKLSKSGSKPLSSNANAPVVGMKRSPPSHSHTPSDGTTKKKKKPSENLLSFSKGKPSAPLPNDASTSSPFPLTAEIKDLKVKFKPIPAKEPEKRKDHGSDGHHKGKGLPHSSKGKDLKGHSLEHKSGSDKKTKGDSSEHKANLKEREKLEQKNPSEKRRKEKKEKKEKREKKIVEKVTIRRSSGDSWASSGSSSGLMPNVLTKNKALGKLLREMSDDEEEAENLLTPFKRETSPKFPKTVGKESNSSHPEKAAVTNRSKHKAKENKTHTNSNNNHTENRSVSHVENGITEKFNSVSEVEERVKTSVDGKECSPGRKQEKNGVTNLPKKELYELYEQITNCQDSNNLQKVVDIIETTGRFTVSEKTFDFDLYSQEKPILRKIQKCLGPR